MGGEGRPGPASVPALRLESLCAAFWLRGGPWLTAGLSLAACSNAQSGRSPCHSCPAPRMRRCHVPWEGPGPGNRPSGGGGHAAAAAPRGHPAQEARSADSCQERRASPGDASTRNLCDGNLVLLYTARAAVGWSPRRGRVAHGLAGSAWERASVTGGHAEAAAASAGTPASTPKALADMPGAHRIPRPCGQSLCVTWRPRLSHVLLANPRRTLESAKATG